MDPQICTVHATFELSHESLEALQRFVKGERGTEVSADWDRRVALAVLGTVLSASKRLDAPPLEPMLYARCAKHYKVPQLNKNEASGAECGACIQEAAQGGDSTKCSHVP